MLTGNMDVVWDRSFNPLGSLKSTWLDYRSKFVEIGSFRQFWIILRSKKCVTWLANLSAFSQRGHKRSHAVKYQLASLIPFKSDSNRTRMTRVTRIPTNEKAWKLTLRSCDDVSWIMLPIDPNRLLWPRNLHVSACWSSLDHPGHVKVPKN